MKVLADFISECVHLWLEMSPYLLFGMAMAGLIHVFLGKDTITRQLGRRGLKSVVKATLLGIPLPICSCGVVPVASSLEREGAHKSSVLAFLVATPTTGVDSIFATYSLLGPLYAIFRPLAALLTGITLGGLDLLIEGQSDPKKVFKPHNHGAIKASFHWREFLKYAFLEIPQDIGRALIIGIGVAACIAVFVPETLFSRLFFFPVDFIIALLLGVPLYVCSTGSIPVAVSLIQKGFSPGAGLVFLIVGPATNAVTMAFVRTKFGRKSFYLYTANIIVIAVLLGMVFNGLWGSLGHGRALLVGGGQMLDPRIKTVAGIIMLFLIVYAQSRPKACRADFKEDMVIEVPGIDCKNCRLSIESALHGLPGVIAVDVDIEKKQVRVKGDADRRVIIEKIRRAGYSPLEN
jgi:Predicted permeases